MQSDHKIVLATVQSDGNAIAYASDELRVDQEIVLAAVQNDNSPAEQLTFIAHTFKNKKPDLKAGV